MQRRDRVCYRPAAKGRGVTWRTANGRANVAGCARQVRTAERLGRGPVQPRLVAERWTGAQWHDKWTVRGPHLALPIRTLDTLVALRELEWWRVEGNRGV